MFTKEENKNLKKAYNKIKSMEDFSKGVSFVTTITVDQLKSAIKSCNVKLGSLRHGYYNEKEFYELLGGEESPLEIPNSSHFKTFSLSKLSYSNLDYKQIIYIITLDDESFSWHYLKNDAYLSKTKLHKAMKGFKKDAINDLKTLGFKLYRPKIIVGNSSKFNLTKQQAQTYSDTKFNKEGD